MDKNIPPSYTHITKYSTVSTNVNTGSYVKLPIHKQEVFESLYECNYGSCAVTAIASAFTISKGPFKAICKAMRIKYEAEGLLFTECKRLINLLCTSYGWKNTYVHNHKKVKYDQMIALLNEKRYIVMFNEHLSYCIKGKIYDGYFFLKFADYKKVIPTGWWEITEN